MIDQSVNGPPPLLSPGYPRTGDAYSDSCHSEISSRSSLVSNSSFDMAQEERRGLRHSGGVGDPHAGGVRLERRATTDPDQYSLGYESMLPIYSYSDEFNFKS